MPGQLPGLPQPTSFDLQPSVSRPLLFIGRQADNDVILADSSVSRHHVEVQVFQDGIAVRDLGSANGTWLNNEQLAPQVRTLVRPGDRLKVGNVLTTLKLTNIAPIEDIPTTALSSNAAQPTVYNPPATPNYGAAAPNPATYGNPNQAGYTQIPAQPPRYNQSQAGAQPGNSNAPLYNNNPNNSAGAAPQAAYNQSPAPEYGYPNNQSGANVYNQGNVQQPSTKQTPASSGYSAYNPAEFAPGYAPVPPTPLPRSNMPPDSYMPDIYPDGYMSQNRQGSQPYPTGPRSAAQSKPRRPGTPYLIIVPLLLAVIIVLAVGGFLLVQALNKNTTSYTTLEQLNLPASPASANSVSEVLGVSVPVFTGWKRAQDPAGNRIVFTKPGQTTTALTIEKPPSATLLNGNLSPEAAVRQYVANVQANAQNVIIATQPVQVKLKDGNLATLTILQFTVPNVVADYRMLALAVQCTGNLYFVTAAAENKNNDTNTDTDLKAAISNARCK